jgi:hypothetical protein
VTKPPEEPAAKETEEAEKPTRVAPLSAVAPESDPDDTPTPDGKTSQPERDTAKTVESKRPDSPPPEADDAETEKERADTGTES